MGDPISSHWGVSAPMSQTAVRCYEGGQGSAKKSLGKFGVSQDFRLRYACLYVAQINNYYPILEWQMTQRVKDTEPIFKDLKTRSSTRIPKLRTCFEPKIISISDRFLR